MTNVPTGALAPKWFPDSQRLAFISRVWPDLKTWDEQGKRQKERKDAKVTARVCDTAGVRYWDRWLDDRQAHVYTIALSGGETTAVTLGTGQQLSRAEPGAGIYDVSPDGQEIAFAVRHRTSPASTRTSTCSWCRPAAAPRSNLTTDNPASDGGPPYSPDGRFLAFGRQQVKGFYGDRVRLVAARPQGRDEPRGHGRVGPLRRRRRLGAGRRARLRRDRRRGHLAPLRDRHRDRAAPGPDATASYGSASLSRDGSTLVALRESFTEPPTLVQVDPRGGRGDQALDLQRRAAREGRLGHVRERHLQGRRRRRHPDVGELPAGLRREEAVPGLPADPRRARTTASPTRSSAAGTRRSSRAGATSPRGRTSTARPASARRSRTRSTPTGRTSRTRTSSRPPTGWPRSRAWTRSGMAAGGGSYGGYLVSVLLGRRAPVQDARRHAGVYNLYTQYAAGLRRGQAPASAGSGSRSEI